MNNQIIKQLVRAQTALKRKNKSLKSDVFKSQSHLEEIYYPVSGPTKHLPLIKKTATIIMKMETSSPKYEICESLGHRKPE